MIKMTTTWKYTTLYSEVRRDVLGLPHSTNISCCEDKYILKRLSAVNTLTKLVSAEMSIFWARLAICDQLFRISNSCYCRFMIQWLILSTSNSSMKEDGGDYWRKVYIVPWCRVGCWAVGMLLGLLIYKRGQKLLQNKVLFDFLYTGF